MVPKKFLSSLALATALLASPIAAFAQQPTSTEGGAAAESAYITIIADGKDLRDVVRQIEQRAGVNIYVEPGIEEVVTVRLVNLPWRQVLEVVAKDAGVEIEPRGSRLFVLTQPPRVSMEFADADIRIVLDLLARQAGKNIVIADKVQGPVTLNLRNVHWQRALETIVKTAGFVVVQDGDDILRVVLASSLTAQLSTLVYPLNYLRPPDDYKAIIRDSGAGSGATASGAGGTFLGNPVAPAGIADFTLFSALQKMVNSAIQESVQYQKESNAFIINATATKHAEIGALLKRIDIEPQQVFIDVKFISTTNGNFWREGLQMGDPVGDPGNSGLRASINMGGTSTSPLLSSPSIYGNAAQNYGGTTTLGQFPFRFGEGIKAFTSAFNVPAILDFSQTQAALQFVDVDRNSKVTQAPTLLTLDDREATIFVGEKVPFITQQSTIDQNGNATITLTESPKSPQQVGFTLFITPHIVRDTDQIIITIIPRVTRLTGGLAEAGGLVRFTTEIPTQFGIARSFIDLPRIADQTVVTKLLVRNNTTAVIGGLMSETVTEVEQRIPILSSIPLIGSLFTFESNDYLQENLIIFVTPRIVRHAADTAELFSKQYQIFQENDFFYLRYLKKDDVEEGESKAKPAASKKSNGAQQAPAGETLGAEEPPPAAPAAKGTDGAPPTADGKAEATPPPPPPAAPAAGGDTPPPPPPPAATGEGTTPPPAATGEGAAPAPAAPPAEAPAPAAAPEGAAPAPAGEGATPAPATPGGGQ